jgi:E3 ubiquitin-protein ligase UBR4
MGIYSYWIKQEIAQMDSWWLDGKKSTSITSLSSFTPIHFECHREAQAYNSQEKKPEWEGAQIRNSDTRCNNWIPIRGPNTS